MKTLMMEKNKGLLCASSMYFNQNATHPPFPSISSMRCVLMHQNQVQEDQAPPFYPQEVPDCLLEACIEAEVLEVGSKMFPPYSSHQNHQQIHLDSLHYHLLMMGEKVIFQVEDHKDMERTEGNHWMMMMMMEKRLDLQPLVQYSWFLVVNYGLWHFWGLWQNLGFVKKIWGYCEEISVHWGLLYRRVQGLRQLNMTLVAQ